jgi:hypothetical protein
MSSSPRTLPAEPPRGARNGDRGAGAMRVVLADPDCAGIQVLLLGRFAREAHVLGALRNGIGGPVDKHAAPDELLRAVRRSASPDDATRKEE